MIRRDSQLQGSQRRDGMRKLPCPQRAGEPLTGQAWRIEVHVNSSLTPIHHPDITRYDAMHVAGSFKERETRLDTSAIVNNRSQLVKREVQ